MDKIRIALADDDPATPLQRAVYDKLQAELSRLDLPVELRLTNTLRWLAKWRSMVIGNTLRHALGQQVQAGPFKGMIFADRAAEGGLAPRLLGCYEHELHPFIEAAIAARYDNVINIGCAEGYYAVGMAMRMPDAKIFAYDIDEIARTRCADMAEKNQVRERIVIGQRFDIADFARFAGQRNLVLCDIEGGEGDLLNPNAAPALREMDLIVEIHDAVTPVNVKSDVWLRLFAATHDITLVESRLPALDIPEPLKNLSHIDQLLAIWEWRAAPTPWAVLRAAKF